jgi:hypothetical protein
MFMLLWWSALLGEESGASGPVLPTPTVITARVAFAPALAAAAQLAPSITATVTVRP